MTTLYIHIGTSKTATSTLQVFLKDNTQRLNQIGVAIPLSVSGGAFSERPISHHTLAWSMTDPTQRPPGKKLESAERMVEMLKSEITDNSTAQTHLVTSEAFFSPYCDPTPLGRLLDHVDVKIVVYLRRQDEWLEANYATNIMMPYPGAASMSHFVEASSDWLDYGRVLERWSNVFGKSNITVRVFEKTKLLGGDVVNDFLTAINTTDQALLKAEKQQFNTRLGAMSLVFLKRIKEVQDETTYRAIVRQIVKLERDRHIEVPKGRFIDIPQRKSILAAVEQSNENVRQNYLPHMAGPLFSSADYASYIYFDETDVTDSDLLRYSCDAMFASRPSANETPSTNTSFIE